MQRKDLVKGDTVSWVEHGITETGVVHKVCPKNIQVRSAAGNIRAGSPALYTKVKGSLQL